MVKLYQKEAKRWHANVRFFQTARGFFPGKRTATRTKTAAATESETAYASDQGVAPVAVGRARIASKRKFEAKTPSPAVRRMMKPCAWLRSSFGARITNP